MFQVIHLIVMKACKPGKFLLSLPGRTESLVFCNLLRYVGYCTASAILAHFTG